MQGIDVFPGPANPIGEVGSAAPMPEHFGLPEQVARLNRAIEATTAAGILTRDVDQLPPRT
ncbi:isocitrate/isopropylmalate family dehydrogenase [Streptomyces sp. NRRL S-646]|uniref:isocitrate/isopropylmalate family dehydrogenase n=1 Tax=Streptomyces sp. NRRL S-646 TaxID=1463917 RepID=UPI0004CA8ABC|nr:isocitrate/isopropylmalate family dehydrogenase [Streptomyces sp. NRRL S-646]